MDFVSPVWSIPFLGIILSMSFLPLLCPSFWNKYSSYVPLFWSLIYLIGIACVFGLVSCFSAVWKPIIGQYLPFIVLIAALYFVSGGIYINFPRGYGPLFNVAFLFSGSLVAGWIGTTGAATLLIRPILRANQNRQYKAHILIFFIFLVANIGGAATPLGDPPLFIGFLEGVDFFWFAKHLYKIILGVTLLLCAIFFVIDWILFKKEDEIEVPQSEGAFFEIQGKVNVALLGVILLAVMLCNFEGNFEIFGEKYKFSSILRNIILITTAFVSMKITPKEVREKNYFSIEPIKEVMELFAGIFITVVPIIYILHQGTDGAFKEIFNWIAPGGNFIASRCFWASGTLSSMLDNAPTFLIFFHMLSGNAVELMTTKANLLSAISMSTVFMGAMTYIGNAPNLMVKSISVDYGIKAPSFLGYMVWSVVILVPIFWIITTFVL